MFFLRTLLIDNYDSFTFNLFHLISYITGLEPLLIKNDALSWAQTSALQFTNIVISPGPGRPENQDDFGISADAILDGRWPILGVCLGHQGICYHLGGQVQHAPRPMHGIIDEVCHTQSGLFHNIPSPFPVVRYHSLAVSELPECLVPTAFSREGLVMAVEHREKPIWGVQFHPESICSEFGATLVSNFIDLSGAVQTRQQPLPLVPVFKPRKTEGAKYFIFTRRIHLWIEPEIFFEVYAKHDQAVFFLDSSLSDSDARFSFIGDASGPHSEELFYRVSTRKLQIRKNGATQILQESILTYMERRLGFYAAAPCLETPFDFAPGFVGYFGYEMKAEMGGSAPHQSPSPDAQFLFADRVLCFDLQEKEIWLLCLDTTDEKERVMAWFDATEQKLRDFQPVPKQLQMGVSAQIKLVPRVRAEEYLRLIHACLSKLRDGESYEICLTNSLEGQAEIDALRIYMRLREINPAPYSAFLRLGTTTILCASPELFIACNRHGRVLSKPIKGTIRRGQNPQEDAELSALLHHSEKERAENLMIVDLIRNDLGKVCEIGSVRVPRIFEIERYATVHQLVSTIEGRLKPEYTLIDLLRAVFPGGSMTGAPKTRTMKILDALESGPRGVYSGALGFLSVTGTMMMNIVIRSIVLEGPILSIGVGGAITALSKPNEELNEINLKLQALLQALAVAAEHSTVFTENSITQQDHEESIKRTVEREHP